MQPGTQDGNVENNPTKELKCQLCGLGFSSEAVLGKDLRAGTFFGEGEEKESGLERTKQGG